ncbi:hypothetical protein GQ43DRAFT_363739 [Delitschia confertaspora ATCC 74209]|uniref:tRNA-splicing endonuclease subunit Sen54 N-terminal domain-containing protein n=1 Tax=Delitschia confertaspora ATCC 74209 TaxID=1513339 RepID=A0A9P4JTH5_9PLEO|nr:hypothetical protein GQ43DRAFT_363739 [Delitschia confertaspora ATCC 74209]
MVDEDEDYSFLKRATPIDIDLSDETQDWRFLSNLSQDDPNKLTLPKRGEKDFEPHETSLQMSTLDASRLAMHNTLSIPRIHPPKSHMLATYDQETNMAYVEKVKSQLFQTLGRFKNGKEWLLPEEALFMLERGTLDIRWPVPKEEGVEENKEDLGVPMSLQGAYAAFIGMEEGVGGKLTLEMYTVYIGLKRAGYIVFRAGTWDDEIVAMEPFDANKRRADQGKGYWGLGFLKEIWKRLTRPTIRIPAHRLTFGPLVGPGLYRSYSDIYRLLQIIPSQTYATAPKLMLPPDSGNPFRVTFDVYRPAGKFRKTAPGSPDFRVAVVNARETDVPTLAQLNDLWATTPDDPPKPTDQMYQKLRHGVRNIILAVVDNGIPSYIRVGDACFAEEKLYERLGRGPRGKGGGRGRGGRGRGRGGRGRGR